jgi:hypothetical protein
MPNPSGDVLIRHINSIEYVVTDAITREALDGPFESFPSALRAAKRLAGEHAVWLEDVDNRGRPLGDPVRIPSP